jgi:PAS domain S-box-containing protein
LIAIMREPPGLLAALRQFADGTFTFTCDGTITALDEGFATLTGWGTAEWVGRSLLHLVHPDDASTLQAALSFLAAGQTPGVLEARLLIRAGIYTTVECSLAPGLEGGRVVNGAGVLRDISARKQLEQRTADAQQSEVVGRLAGGVAHYFNNLMTSVLGFSELLLNGLSAEHPHRFGLEEIHHAGKQAAHITAQLLAFARRQILQPVTLDVNEVVTAAATLHRTLHGGNVQLETKLDPTLRPVFLDRQCLERLFMSLLLNAQDAMPGGGRLFLATANVQVDAALVQMQPELRVGPYVLALVSDTGKGMDDTTLAHLCEPFHTGKQFGESKGLSLAAGRGFLQQSGGCLCVASRVGQGTTWAILLPAQ